jgi:hypothetical protein
MSPSMVSVDVPVHVSVDVPARAFREVVGIVAVPIVVPLHVNHCTDTERPVTARDTAQDSPDGRTDQYATGTISPLVRRTGPSAVNACRVARTINCIVAGSAASLAASTPTRYKAKARGTTKAVCPTSQLSMSGLTLAEKPLRGTRPGVAGPEVSLCRPVRPASSYAG